MGTNKTEFLNMRVKPETKRALRLIAERENRSMANTLEWLIADYLAKNRIEVPSPARKRVQTHTGQGV